MIALLFLLSAELTVSGRVTDARTGEALRRASIQLGEGRAETDSEGRYALRVEAGGPVAFQVAAVGYRPVKRVLEASTELDVALHPDTLRQADAVTVSAGPFDAVNPGALDLAGSELRNLASVLADDPLRAMQSLPGVGAYSDFQAQLTVRGASFERIGLYYDGVLLHAPFHAVQGEDSGASLALFQGELLESAALEAGPLAPRYGDRTAGAADFRTRDGDRQRRHFRASASASNAGLTAEGPLGKRLTWITGVRKSYLQYIIERTADEPGLAFGFWDAQGKLRADLGRHQASLTLLRGGSGLDRSAVLSRLSANAIAFSGYDSLLAIGTWRWTTGRALVTQRFAWLGEEFENGNRERLPLARSRYQERIWNGDAGWTWSPRNVTEAGWSLRAARDGGAVNQVVAPALRAVERYAGAALRSGAYLQQTWSPRAGFDLRAGGRADRHEWATSPAWTPYAALAVPLPGRVRLSLSWSQAAQFAEIRQFTSPRRKDLAPERAQHTSLVLERTLGERSRLRLELFERRDRDGLFRPLGEPRLVNGRLVNALIPAPWENSLRGRVRGWQAMWQGRSANGLTGWVAYTYARTTYSDRITGASFISDYDLRNQVQAFLSYRLRPTVNVSGRFAWATGLPLRGYYERRGAEYFIAAQRNRLRLPDYQRTDLRVNKALVRKRYQATLFAEVINVTNHRNVRLDDIGTPDPRTGRVRLPTVRTFPILPSAGVVFDF